MPIAIIGAGAAGCAAAYALREYAPVTLFEKSRGASGRAATRRHDGVVYDHGANYIKPTDRVRQLLAVTLGGDGLACITPPVWTFDGDGHLAPGDRPWEKKWTYREGINQIGKCLLAKADAELATQTRIVALHREGCGWHLTAEDGRTFGPFDACLLTPPAPQAADLIAASDFEGDRDGLAALLSDVPFRSQFSVVLGFSEKLERPAPFYALVNTDGAHDIAWLAFESDKPDHVPDGHDALVLQMSPDWTQRRYDDPHDALAADAHLLAERLLGHALPAPAWHDVQRWRYALPDRGVDRARLAALTPPDLHFAGDWVAGKGRVALALESGLDAAAAITSR